MEVTNSVLKHIYKMAKLVVLNKPMIPALRGVYLFSDAYEGVPKNKYGTDKTFNILSAIATNVNETMYITVMGNKNIPDKSESMMLLLDDIKPIVDHGYKVNFHTEVNEHYASTGGNSFAMFGCNPQGMLKYATTTTSNTPPEKSIPVDMVEFKEAIKKLYFSMGKDKYLRNLNGMHMEVVDNKIRLVSSDGWRLTLQDLPTTEEVAMEPILMSAEFITILSKLKDFTLYIKEGYLFAQTTTYIDGYDVFTTFISKPMEEKFPDYRYVIPKARKHVFRFDTIELRDTLRKIVKAKNEKVELVFSHDALKLTTDSKSYEIPPEEGLSHGLKLSVVFNPKFLLEGIEACDELDLCLSPNGENEPLDIYWGTNRHILMPIRK